MMIGSVLMVKGGEVGCWNEYLKCALPVSISNHIIARWMIPTSAICIAKNSQNAEHTA